MRIALPTVVAAAALLLVARSSAAADPPPAVWQLGPFERPAGVNPVVSPDARSTFADPMHGGRPVAWEAGHTFNPAAVVKGGQVWLLYRAEDASGKDAIGGHTSRLGLAHSDDGLHFTRQPAPVLFPGNDDQKDAEWPGGCEDPRVIAAPDGRFVLTYTQWNHKLPRLAVATSPDLQRWTKHGTAFAPDTDYAAQPSKSGAILGKLDADGRLVAAKVNGHFWMYWGEGDIKLATSDDLVRWTTVETAPGHSLAVLPRRPGHFDSALAEAGPPAVLTDRGIVVVYNGKNAAKGGDASLPANTYAAGQALFDAADPAKLLDRPDAPCYRPAEPFERAGQYAAGTTFAEGLVRFHDRWLLYYGCADSLVGVAATR